MSPRLPADLLDRSPQEAVRLLALKHLYDAASARQRLDDPSDREALHDLRVAVRHLREVARAYRPQLRGSVGRRVRRRLRQVTNDTNALRDAEVLIEWLGENRDSLPEAAQPGADFLRGELERRQPGPESKPATALRRRWDRLADKLERRLRRCTTPVDPGELGPRLTFRAVAAQLVAHQVGQLRGSLAVVETPADQRLAHQARIVGKRLRYLLEPLPGADNLVDRLKQLQDHIGHLHDLQVLGDEVKRALAGTMNGEVRDGLLALAAFAAQRAEELFARVHGDWFGDHAEQLLGGIAEFANRLEGDAGGAPQEIERKYLLRGLPERARTAPFADIEQGWIPGTALRERLRRSRSGDLETFTRTIKFGEGVRRTELEEEATRETFEALWPLTAARRIAKRRYTVADGELEWEIDAFEGRDLVLAEVELKDENAVVTLPDWLAPFVVREVTDEAEYVNFNLAG